VWRRKREPEPPPEPVLDSEMLNDIITMLMRIDANVQLLLYGEEDDGEERD
jgi:hypothetical protein